MDSKTLQVIKMDKIKVFLMIVLLIPCSAYSQNYFDHISKKDLILQGILTGLICIDWSQTKKFREDGKKESNIFFGKEPDQSKVDTLIFSGIIAHSVVSFLIKDDDMREVWQMLFIIIEIDAINHNQKYGYSVKLYF